MQCSGFEVHGKSINVPKKHYIAAGASDIYTRNCVENEWESKKKMRDMSTNTKERSRKIRRSPFAPYMGEIHFIRSQISLG
uniref:Uncharacterized protein n=1 Tax=Romanomermis culicivorax TaxID=13658 RepID=A0A915IJ13_ROMCU